MERSETLNVFAGFQRGKELLHLFAYGYYGQYVFGDSEAADAQGYQDGLKTGSNDARRRQSYDPDRSHYFKDAGFGNFASAYREGFLRGYGDGFHG